MNDCFEIFTSPQSVRVSTESDDLKWSAAMVAQGRDLFLVHISSALDSSTSDVVPGRSQPVSQPRKNKSKTQHKPVFLYKEALLDPFPEPSQLDPWRFRRVNPYAITFPVSPTSDGAQSCPLFYPGCTCMTTGQPFVPFYRSTDGRDHQTLEYVENMVYIPYSMDQQPERQSDLLRSTTNKNQRGLVAQYALLVNHCQPSDFDPMNTHETHGNLMLDKHYTYSPAFQRTTDLQSGRSQGAEQTTCLRIGTTSCEGFSQRSTASTGVPVVGTPTQSCENRVQKRSGRGTWNSGGSGIVDGLDDYLPALKVLKNFALPIANTVKDVEMTSSKHERNAEAEENSDRREREEPRAKRTKNSQGVHDQHEKDLIRQFLEEEINVGNRTERKWQAISEKLAQHGIQRTRWAVKSWWSREGRSETGFEERQNPTGRKMVTSKQDPEERRKARERRKAGLRQAQTSTHHIQTGDIFSSLCANDLDASLDEPNRDRTGASQETNYSYGKNA